MQKLINFIMTPNEMVCDLLIVPLMFIDSIVNMLLFSTILNLKLSKKQKIIYIISTSLTISLIKILLPNNVSFIFCILVYFTFINLIFKPKLLKSVIAIGILVLASGVGEITVVGICKLIINFDYTNVINIPIYRLVINSSIYLVIYILYRIAKFFKLNIKIIDTMPKKTKRLLISNSIIGILSFIPYMVFISFYRGSVPSWFLLYIFFSIISFFTINIYTTIKSTELVNTKQELETTNLQNKTLSLMYDNIRAFKHDFNNMVQIIGGYVSADDMKGLKKYYSSLLEDCQKVNNLSALNPETINNPSIYGLLASKYHMADQREIKVNLEIFMDLNTLKTDMYKLTKILGILLDNAIEAAEECENKIVNITMRQDPNKKIKLMEIENTYLNKNIDIAKIFEKDYSTKNRNSGIGLWEVKKIIDRTPTLELFTNKNNEYFKQVVEIYA